MYHITSKVFFIFIFLISLTTLLGSTVKAGEKEIFPRAPEGFGKFMVFMATGEYDISGPDFGMPDGLFFHEEIMQRTPEEIAIVESNAKQFFNERFGIDPDDPANTGRIRFEPFMLDPRNNYRAYVISGMRVPSTGFEVFDGGFVVLVIDPDGFTLGGEFAGEHTPFGSGFVFGDYKIDLSSSELAKKMGKDDIIIHYESGFPIVVQPGKTFFLALRLMFQCLLSSDEYGDGIAQGMSAGMTLDNGLFQANLRNVLTFPAFGESKR